MRLNLVPRAREAPIARFATCNNLDDGGKRRHVDARTERSQEEPWAACIAEEPALIAEIVNFIATARQRIIESPPVAPGRRAEPRDPPTRK